MQQQVPQSRIVSDRQQHLLPQQDEFLTQLVLHLHPVYIHGDSQSLYRIVAKEYPVMLLNIEQLNGEHIGGSLQLELGHAERWRLLLAVPPLRDRRELLELRERAVAQNAQEIQI